MKTNPKKPTFIDSVRIKLREKGYSKRTEEIYVSWIKRYILFHNKNHPANMDEKDVSKFLNHLYFHKGVSYSTQRQALSAILFLYREIVNAMMFPGIFMGNFIIVNRANKGAIIKKSQVDKKSNGHKLKVFLCHAQEDKPIVRRLYSRLIKDGVQPWFDEEDLIAGQDWEVEIEKAVRNTDLVLVCLSNKSVTKAGYVQKEIKYALDVADQQPEDTVFIIPLKLEACILPNRLKKWQALDFFSKTGYNKLIKSLNKRSLAL
jgi:hypothetical protein